MENLNLLESAINEIDHKMKLLRNERYVLNKEYIKLKQEECKQHIGKCFVKDKWYYMIVDTDDIISSLYDGPSFNPYQYKTIKFEYPYNNNLGPIMSDKVFFNFNKNRLIDKKEISKEEFMLRFKEVNQQWLESLNKL